MEQTSALLETLLQQENDLQFSEFTNNTAYKVGTAIVEKAFREDKSVAVNIRMNGELLFYARMNGTTDNNDSWIARKNNTVGHFKHSSYYMHVLLKSTGSNVEAHNLDPKDYAAEGGAFPLILKNEGIVGTISVSGLPGEEDHAIIVGALREILNG
ncbi:heme-degrading domain-containing protein [Paenibacillus humicola]|uniref:heme-degrading domain-containing protein n=1 Tax=Paenibacillus humicola TaxID=3110540 RepID=UPI00237BAD7B|nr:heme-degrading domain-containing protein [Paenibacillus humicola]